LLLPNALGPGREQGQLLGQLRLLVKSGFKLPGFLCLHFALIIAVEQFQAGYFFFF
jgi:hypothetical protein